MGKRTGARQTTTAQATPEAKLHKGDVAPTREWIARYGDQVHSPTNPSGQKIGRAYLRRPWFESLVERDWREADQQERPPVFSVSDLKALRFYRDSVEASARSETKSCLAAMLPVAGSRSDGPSPAIVRAKANVAWLEALLGPLVSTVRAVAIDDQSYAQVAMERFGAREQDWFDDTSGTFIRKLAPKSGRHPTRIREEFVAGVKRLSAGRSEPVVTVLPTGGFVVDDPRSGRPICDAIDAKLVEVGVATGIAASITVAEAIARENGATFDHTKDELDYAGLPVTVKAGWAEGAWMVVVA